MQEVSRPRIKWYESDYFTSQSNIFLQFFVNYKMYNLLLVQGSRNSPRIRQARPVSSALLMEVAWKTRATESDGPTSYSLWTNGNEFFFFQVRKHNFDMGHSQRLFLLRSNIQKTAPSLHHKENMPGGFKKKKFVDLLCSQTSTLSMTGNEFVGGWCSVKSKRTSAATSWGERESCDSSHRIAHGLFAAAGWSHWRIWLELHWQSIEKYR